MCFRDWWKNLERSLNSDSFSTNAYVAIIQCTTNVLQRLVEKPSARRQKAGGRRQKGRKVILQAFEPFLTG
ncbi:hypothetical protein [Okeania sp. SIO2B3]|uniref:hypothetical protein n=1 Tax=Okeania sp. SIO2B3 TaxID=2607784 RepID=UPI0013BEC5D4|nr:hypothetical protein [Okeania sp. SIO2B3]NET43720.1 hypothetical protein [Okeania sp. SIO2B3]